MPASSAKKLRSIRPAPGGHWVGDGFPVRTLFAYPELGTVLSPFLMLDYAGPSDFPPTEQRLGVGEHPHRGFETVTIVYEGEVEHRDSAGGGGKIGPGDVQWMTAASGLVHEEFHGRDYAKRGGKFEMVQLWINLPAKDKMSAPHYQGILNEQIPSVILPDNAGTARVIAGEFEGSKGPARTFTAMNVLDLDLISESAFSLAVPDGWTTALVVLRGLLRTSSADLIGPAEVAIFERTGNCISFDSADYVTALLLCGEPIDEPIVGSGPFVMNTPDEIRQAISDYQSGKMGHLG
jgi:redox-sensitive bicupin YhaK (pirin superfamily)